ncbi:hypothetical protein KFZ76_09415 [Methylovulum psychrotolerans]|uniref:hypothetical protein n=1 Tax=Methylovulum psychrotolerans TaxID=1704499 RepID=UPI001BFF711F|nr:hypothetical protein [Methylovulum psychrotolerans]MBT9097920.1 hypothetical protein [Methylovulum psychrotolerans]
MQAIRQIIDTKKLQNVIDIPDDFSSDTVEVIVFPMLPRSDVSGATDFTPELFFGVSRLEQVGQLLEAMRNEWDD